MFRLSVLVTAGVGVLFAALTGLWVPIVRALPHEMLAFSATVEGSHTSAVYILDIRTGLIFKHPKGSSPSWSQDGQQVAYVKYVENRAVFYTSDPLGRNNRIIASYSRYPPNRVWSTDRRRNALIIGAQKRNFFASFGRNFVDLLENLRVDERFIAWSPDGTKLAFVSSLTGYRNIYTLDVTAGTLFQVTTTRGSDTTPVWSPDGAKIAFISTRHYHPEIYIINADGTGEQLVNHIRLSEYTASILEWSADGKQLTFYNPVDRSFYCIDTAGGLPQRRLALSSFSVSYADWYNN